MMKQHSRPTGKSRQLLYRALIILILGSVLSFSLILGLAACQPESDGGEPAVEVAAEGKSGESEVDSSNSISQTEKDDPETEATSQPPPDPDILWASSGHADTFVMGDDGTNIKCARCHAPIQWVPTMDDIPESCLTCKFEVAPPPPVVSEAEWEHVPCQVCHKVKKDEVKPEYVWLEIAQIEEYAEVESTSELCLKCHETADVPGHEQVVFTEVHQDLTCTECHDAHGNVSGCAKSGCHEDVMTPAEPIEGHDEDHNLVSCMACHDAAGLEVGLDEQAGQWTTLLTAEGDESVSSFMSHEVQTQVQCDRCHFPDNSWGLSGSVSAGS